MGEPAYKLPEEDRPDLPGLRALEGGGEGDGVPRGKLSSVADTTAPPTESPLLGTSPGDSPATKNVSFRSTLMKGRISKKVSRRLIGGGVTGTIIGAVLAIAGIASGPLQLVHLSQILSKNFAGSDHASSLRIRGLYRYAKTGDVGETRVVIGSKTFAKTTAQLKDIGIEFRRNAISGNPDSMTIDSGKFAERYPELKNMSVTNSRALISRELGIPINEINRVNNGSSIGSHKFAINAKDYSIKATRILSKNTVSLLDDGKIVTAMRLRTMAKFFNTPSLWHPFKRASANLENKTATKIQRRAAEKEREKAFKATDTPEVTEAKSRLKEKLSGARGAASAALLLTAITCLVRSSADDAVTVDRATVAVPAALNAADKLAAGAQTQTNQDIEISQPAGVVDTFTDDKGNSIWTGQALQATSTPTKYGGEDLAPEYKQAFVKDNTAANLKASLGGGDFGAVACSTPGLIIQFAGSLALLFFGPETGGATWAAFAAKTSVQFATTAGVFYLLQHQLTNILTHDTALPETLSGPVGGNLLAYGAREAAAIGGRSSGEIPISAQAASLENGRLQQISNTEFQQRSLLSRALDTKDYRSLISRTIDSPTINSPNGMKLAALNLLQPGKLIGKVFGAIFSNVGAENKPYDWGTQDYGIPESMLNDPALEDPYQNAQLAAEIVKNDDSYIKKADDCFGANISLVNAVWAVTPSHDVNPNSSRYVDANCGNIKDTKWQRIIMFVFDSRTMEAVACHQNSDPMSCQNSGFGVASAAPAATDGAASSTTNGQIIGDIGLSSTNVQCAAGTTELGNVTSQYDGTAKKETGPIMIKLCQLSSITGQGRDTLGNRTSAGAVVNSRVSGAWQKLGEKAKSSGLTLSATSSFRLADSCGGGGDGTLCAKANGSMHQLGVAIDFDGPTAKNPSAQTCAARVKNQGNPTWDFLNTNAASFGFKQYSAEAWHWDPLAALNRCGGDGS